MTPVLTLPAAGQVRLGGVLGQALEASRAGRLSHFVVDAASPAIALFDPARAEGNQEGDWYGEHAGKWLIAAARAASDGRHGALRDRVMAVADYLADVQRADGYLGTYAADRRFMVAQPPRPWSWDGAPALRTWDVWTHAYLILGLLEAWKLGGRAWHLEAARRIGALCHRVFVEQRMDITTCGNHFGMSATVLLDGAVELYLCTEDPCFLALARRIVAQADAYPPLALTQRLLAGADASEIATGKAYQLLWNAAALAKLARASGDMGLVPALEQLWQGIHDRHLSLAGGPWGGAGLRSRECFNPPFVFDPQGYVETCSTLAWIQFTRELMALTGHARYADAIERAALNDLLGAMAEDGQDWCYYNFANGRRVHTTYWRCCKSSGAMALEELPMLAYAFTDEEVRVNLFTPSDVTLAHGPSPGLRLVQQGEGLVPMRIVLALDPRQAATFTLALRQPGWSRALEIHVDGARQQAHVDQDGYIRLHRRWTTAARVEIVLATEPCAQYRSNINVQESRAPDGTAIAQEVLRYDYVGFTWGPLAYAAALADDDASAPSIGWPQASSPRWLKADGAPGDDLQLVLPDQTWRLSPFWRVGSRVDGTWHVTWFRFRPGAPARGAASFTNCQPRT
jgi:DUF1680 family protein